MTAAKKAAAKKTQAPAAPAPAPAAATGSADRQPDFLWDGKPVYRCRHCLYERIENLASVLQHEASHQPPSRPSLIVGPGGEALQVAGEDADS